MKTETNSEWLDGTPTAWQIMAVLFTGTVGVLVAGVQPVLLGTLHSAGRLSATEIGHAATLELLTLCIGVIFGETVLDGRPLRPIALVSLAILFASNFATLSVDGSGVLAARAIAGFPGGVLVWLASAFVVRSPNPTRWSAIYLMAQALLQFFVAAAAGAFAPGDAAFVPVALALFSLAALATVGGIPARFKALPKEPTVSGLPPVLGMAVLVVVLFVQAAIVGAWVYVEPLGAAAGLTPAQVALATPLSLASQLVGGAGAIYLASRVSWFSALAFAIAGLAAVLFALSKLPAPIPFLALEALFGGLWIFISPFFTPMALESDATRRTAVIAPSAVLLGAALGPFAVSFVVGGADTGFAVRICSYFAVTALGLVTLLRLALRSAGARPGP